MIKIKEESKQTLWETWFVISCMLILIVIFIGVTENSRIMFPSWPYFAGIVLINFIYCIMIGTRVVKESEDDK